MCFHIFLCRQLQLHVANQYSHKTDICSLACSLVNFCDKYLIFSCTTLLSSSLHCCSLQDPYLCRPLPFLIGSEEFESADNVGIGAQLEQGM